MSKFRKRGSMSQGDNPLNGPSRKDVYYTDNLGMFIIMNENREVSPQNVKQLMSSIRIKGIHRPIIVNSSKEVIDGQHRLTVAKLLAKEGKIIQVPYVISNDYDISQVMSLNTNQRTLTRREYVEMWADRDKSDYSNVLRLIDNYDVALSTTLRIAKSDPKVNEDGFISIPNIPLDEVETGQYRHGDLDFAEEFLDYIQSFKDEVGMKRMSDAFIRVVYEMYLFPREIFDPIRFKERVTSTLKKYGGLDQYNKEDLKSVLNEIYNYNMKSTMDLTIYFN